MFINNNLLSIQSFFSAKCASLEKKVNQQISQNALGIVAVDSDIGLAKEDVVQNEDTLQPQKNPNSELYTVTTETQAQLTKLCKVLPSELWMQVLERFSLKDLYLFRGASRDACEIVNSLLPVAPRSNLFANHAEMHGFMANIKNKTFYRAVYILNQLLLQNKAKYGNMEFVKTALELLDSERTIDDLINASLFNDEQVKILENAELTPKKQRYLTSSSCILERVRGAEYNLDAFLKLDNFYVDKGILHAIRDNNEQAIKDMVASGLYLNVRNASGHTPLHTAAIIEDLDAVSRLLRLGAKIDIEDYDGCTALHRAAQARISDLVPLLLKNGANAHSVDYTGGTPLLYAMAHFRQNNAKALLNAMTHCDHLDMMGRSALHYAVVHHDIENFKTLLSKNVNVNIQSAQRETPLHYAAIRRFNAFYVPLLSAGAKVNQPDGQGLSVLHHAAKNGSLPAMKLFIEYGAYTNMPDDKGWTPLHYAASNGHEWAVDLLIFHGASPHVVCKKGRTPLHIAAKAGKAEIIRRLLKVNASPEQPDLKGNIALRYAMLNLHAEAAKILLAHRMQSFVKNYFVRVF